MRDEARDRVAKSKFRSEAQTIEKAGDGAPQSDEVIAAVGARAEHCVRGAQLFEREPQHCGGKSWRVRADNHRSRMPAKKFMERLAEALPQATAPLPAALESARNHPLWQVAPSRKKITRCPALKPCNFGEHIGNQRAVKPGCSARAERGNQPGLGLSGGNRTGKDGHGRHGARCLMRVKHAFRRSPRARLEGHIRLGIIRAGAGVRTPA